tara:strand:- start:8228 stop:8935 length:708 start_codon:yes stop_codon:yes gene_type:complete
MTNINQSKLKKATRVFNDVFNKYDVMNDIMSFGIHRIWKKRLIDWMNPKKGDYLVDVASGTGDIANAFLKRINYLGKVACVEPNKLMMNEGKNKFKNLKNISWHHSLAEKLPFKDETFDTYSVSFGMRNFADINSSLKEARRVLKIGGRIICLEFSKIDNEILNKFYKLYSKSIPLIGKYVVGNSEPYEYLTKTIEEFYSQRELKDIFIKNGFDNVEFRNLSGGIVAIHSGWKIE